MPEQLIDEVQVHIIMMHLVVASGIAADIAVGVHLSAPTLFGPGHIHGRVLRRMGYRGRHLGHLTTGIGVEMADSPVGPAEHITQIAGPPAGKRHTPADTAVQPCLPVPVAIGCDDKGTAKGIDIGVGRVELDAGRQGTIPGLGSSKLPPPFGDRQRRHDMKRDLHIDGGIV